MNKSILSIEQLNQIANIIKSPDGVIAFPTDTVWGVGCNINNINAVNKIYESKNRPKNKPLILLGNNIDSLSKYVKEIPDEAKDLMRKFFPGALTIILPKSDLTPDYITSGFSTVGIRMPNHQILLDILEHAVDSHVLATTSANISGEEAGNSKDEVEKYLKDSVDLIIDDYGFKSKGEASTIVVFNEDGSKKILRQGNVFI